MKVIIHNWIVTYGTGHTCAPVLLYDAVKQNFPEMKFEFDGKQFTVEFNSRSEYMAARDSSINVPVKIISANRSKRVKGTIFNKKQMHADIKGALEQIETSYKGFTHKNVPMTKEQVKFVLEWAEFYGYTNTGELTDSDVDNALLQLENKIN